MIPNTLVKRALSHINRWSDEKVAPRIETVGKNLTDRILEVLSRDGNTFTSIFGGPRQGKTHTLHAIIARLLSNGVPAGQILFVDFDSVLLRTAELAVVLNYLHSKDTDSKARKYIIIDNAHWLDSDQLQNFEKTFRDLQPAHFVLTGSSLIDWNAKWEGAIKNLEIHKHEVRLPPFNFVDYLNFHGVDASRFPPLPNLRDLFKYGEKDFVQLAAKMQALEIHFEKYLCVGAHPAALALGTETAAQQWTRRELIEKVFQQDIPMADKGRTPINISHLFVQLFNHDDLLLDMVQLCKVLKLKRPQAERHIQMLIRAGLVNRVSPPDYDPKKNRAMHVTLMADPAILSSLALNTEEATTPGLSRHSLIGSAVYLHLLWGGQSKGIQIGHGRSKGPKGVQFVTGIGQRASAIDVQCLDRKMTANDLREMVAYCAKNGIEYGYVVTQSFDDFGADEFKPDGRMGTSTKLSGPIKILRLPAALFCYGWGLRANWLSSPKSVTLDRPASTELQVPAGGTVA